MKKELTRFRIPIGPLGAVAATFDMIMSDWTMRGYWRLELKFAHNKMDQAEYVLLGEKRPDDD